MTECTKHRHEAGTVCEKARACWLWRTDIYSWRSFPWRTHYRRRQRAGGKSVIKQMNAESDILREKLSPRRYILDPGRPDRFHLRVPNLQEGRETWIPWNYFHCPSSITSPYCATSLCKNKTNNSIIQMSQTDHMLISSWISLANRIKMPVRKKSLWATNVTFDIVSVFFLST